MQQEVTIQLAPSKIRPIQNGKYFQKNHTAPLLSINFVKMENNEAVFRIKVKSDEKIAARCLKKEAKRARLPLRMFVRSILSHEDTMNEWLYELAVDWANRKGMPIEEAPQ